MSTSDADLVLLDGRLRIRAVDELGEVVLNDFQHNDARLLIVVDGVLVYDDPICHYIFSTALGDRGDLALVDAHQLEVLVSDVVPDAERAADWLSDAHLTVTVVVVEPVPLALVAAAVLVATGLPLQASVTAVEVVLPCAFCDRDLDVGLSVFRDHLEHFRGRRSAQEREAWS